MENKMRDMLLSSKEDRLEDTPTTEDWENWVHFAATLKEPVKPSPETPPFLKRIGFSLYHNKVLEDRMTQLDSMTSDLKSWSREEYGRIT